MLSTKLSLTFSYIRTFPINFTKIDLMVDPVIVIIIMIILIVTLLNSTTVPTLTPIWIISPILGINLCTRCNPLIIGIIPTFISGMGLAWNLTLNYRPLILLGLYLKLGLTYAFIFMLSLYNTHGNTPSCIGEHICLMG